MGARSNALSPGLDHVWQRRCRLLPRSITAAPSYRHQLLQVRVTAIALRNRPLGRGRARSRSSFPAREIPEIWHYCAPINLPSRDIDRHGENDAARGWKASWKNGVRVTRPTKRMGMGIHISGLAQSRQLHRCPCSWIPGTLGRSPRPSFQALSIAPGHWNPLRGCWARLLLGPLGFPALPPSSPGRPVHGDDVWTGDPSGSRACGAAAARRERKPLRLHAEVRHVLHPQHHQSKQERGFLPCGSRDTEVRSAYWLCDCGGRFSPAVFLDSARVFHRFYGCAFASVGDPDPEIHNYDFKMQVEVITHSTIVRTAGLKSQRFRIYQMPTEMRSSS
ncbi:uncharacterized protein LOC9654775 [Selaginella moellendorffii]|uniref:uncharacterized protein LOC9654775 n=1 Tax=Selaginella moellendorffii TaxID=88036 RepID=UPI000D1C9D24|nr:uncharacterized protein LOC9654775 [Selaginella moellendorffii]|eukprot:XP_024544017.1 uncharacterized protein LOC9654775 [Selaginella moellendorffii]